MAQCPAGQRKVPGQRAHVKPLGGFNFKGCRVGRIRQQFESVNRHGSGGEFKVFALPGKVVGPLALDLDRRYLGRHLHDVAMEGRHGRPDIVFAGADFAGIEHRAFGVIRRRARAKSHGKGIGLGAVHHIGHGLRRLPQRHRQHTGRQRIKRAAMTRLLRVEQPTDPIGGLRRLQPL